MRITSTGGILWSAQVRPTQGSGLNATPNCVAFFNGFCYVTTNIANGTSVVNVLYVNADGTSAQFVNSQGAGRPSALLGRISSAGFWSPTAMEAFAQSASAPFGCNILYSTLAIDSINNRLYMGGIFQVGGGGGGSLNIVTGAGTVTYAGDGQGSAFNAASRAWYTQINLATFTVTWINGARQASAPACGSFTNVILVDPTANVYVLVTKNNSTTNRLQMWPNPGPLIDFPNNNGFSIVFQINPANGYPLWRKTVSSPTALSDITAIALAGSRLYVITNNNTANITTLYGDVSIPSVDLTIPPTASTASYFLEITPATGFPIAASLHTMTPTVNTGEGGPDMPFFCSRTGLFYFVFFSTAGSYNYTGSPTFTATTTRSVFIYDANLNGDLFRSLNTLSEDFHSCDALGVYAPADKGLIQDGVSVPNGGIILFNEAALPVYGILVETGTAGSTHCVAIRGIYTNPSYSLVPGTIYYYDAITNSLTTTYIPNQQVGKAITTTSIEILPIQGDLLYNVNANTLVVSGTSVLGGGAQVGGTLTVDNISPLSTTTLNYLNTVSLDYNNVGVPVASTIIRYYRTLSNLPTAPALGGGGTLTNVFGPAITTATPGTVVMFDMTNFRAPTSDNVGVTYAAMYKLDLLGYRTTVAPAYVDSTVIFAVLIDTTPPPPDSFSALTVNLVSVNGGLYNANAGDTLSIYIDNGGGFFQLWYTQAAGTTHTVLEGDLQVYTTGGST